MKDTKTPAILKTLRKELEAGKYPVNSRFPSEYELANRFDINKTTANKLVAALVAEGLLARGKRGCGTRVLKETPFPKGQIIFFAKLPAYHVVPMLQGAIERSFHEKYTITPLAPPSNFARVLSMLPGSPFKGILTTAYDIVEAPAGIPVIHIDQEFPESDKIHHAVNADIYSGSYDMMKEALKTGHRNIVITLSDYSGIHLGKVINGFRQAMAEAGITDIDKREFSIQEYCYHGFKITFRKIIKTYPDVTLIATESDNDVVYFQQVIRTDFPEYMHKIRFIGMGHVAKLAEYNNFATVDQHMTQLGAIAVDKIIDMIENGEPEQALRETIPCELCNVNTLAMPANDD